MDLKDFLETKNTGGLAACAAFWDFSDIAPFPREPIACPQCGQLHTSVMRRASYHLRPDSPSKYRCAVHFKCTACSLVFIFGVVVPEAMYNAHENRHYTYHDLRRLKGLSA